MKKIFASFLMILMALSVNAMAKTKLTMYHHLEQSNPVTVENFNEVLAKFNETYPDIELEIEYGFDEPYHNKLQALAVAQDLPDLIFLWPGKRTSQVTSRGLVKDLRPFLAKETAEFAAMAMAPQGPNGELWELPEQVTATHVVYSNDKLLKDLGLTYPKTLDDLIKASKVIRDAGLIPFTAGNKSDWVMQSCMFSTFVDRMGGTTWFDNAISGNGASFADKPFVDALGVLRTLEQEQVFVPGINQMPRSQAFSDFTTGKAVFFVEGGWMVNEVIKSMKPEFLPHVSLHTFPTIPGQKGADDSTAAVPGTGFGINAKLSDEKAEAAWKWVYFFSGPEGSKIKMAQGWIPAVKIDPPEGTHALTKKLMAFLGEKPMTYVLDNKMDAEGMGILHPALQEIILGVKTPEEAANEYESWVKANDSARK